MDRQTMAEWLNTDDYIDPHSIHMDQQDGTCYILMLWNRLHSLLTYRPQSTGMCKQVTQLLILRTDKGSGKKRNEAHHHFCASLKSCLGIKINKHNPFLIPHNSTLCQERRCNERMERRLLMSWSSKRGGLHMS